MKQLPDKFSVYAKTLEEAKYITEKQRELCKYGSFQSPGYFRFDITNQDSGRNSCSYIKDAFLRQEYNITQEFTFEEFKSYFEEQNNIEDMELISIKKLKLDQEYVVYLETKEEWEILNKLVDGKGLCLFCKEECHSLYNGTHSFSSSKTNPGSYRYNDKPSKIITIYQIKEYQDMENKQIIGYKLSETKFLKAAVAIEGFQETGFSNIENRVFTLKEHQESINRWKEADVLNSWFTPVYETKEEIISINGQFNLKVKDKRVYHNGNEDITDYVKSMGEWYENIPKKFGKYDFIVMDITLSKTGCESKETHISQWLKVYNLIK